MKNNHNSQNTCECIFCNFVSGRWKKHRDKYKFEIIEETPNTISFHSIDFPSPKREHVLVIPKKHYENLEDCPKKILTELIQHVSLMSKALRLENEGCNILLNDGRSAEQSVMHAHFHVVPRNDKDGIEIELWKRVNISEKEYSKLNKKIKALVKKVKLKEKPNNKEIVNKKTMKKIKTKKSKPKRKINI